MHFLLISRKIGTKCTMDFYVKILPSQEWAPAVYSPVQKLFSVVETALG